MSGAPIDLDRVRAYLTCHAENDLEGVMRLFADDAVVEDPVGSEIHSGREAIRAFYAATHAANGPITIDLVGPILVGGDEVALHVRAGLDRAGSPPPMDVIYTIRFAKGGLFSSLRAWF